MDEDETETGLQGVTHDGSQIIHGCWWW